MKEPDSQNKMTRRRALKLIGAAALTPFADPRNAESRTRAAFEFVPSSLTPERLLRDKQRAARRLVDEFLGDNAARGRITETIFKGKNTRVEIEQDLVRRSRMAIPTEQEAHQVLHDYPEQLGELIENTPVNEQGLFVAGDTQRLYVLKNIGAGQIQFEKAYTVTTSEEDWSNVVGSEGTSLGLQWITEVREGFLGEILSEKHKKELRGHFGPPVVTHRGPVLIAKSLDKGGNQLASVITVGLLLWDRFNGSQRGELIHGTNREDILGERASGGCTRMSNVDAVDILQYVKTSALNSKGEMVKKGTPVMVAAKGRVPVYRKPSVQSKARSKELKWDFWGPRK